MKIPDEEISKIVVDKLFEKKRWNTLTVNKIASWIKDGNFTASDLIFQMENQRNLENGVLENESK